ncbi:hypothetical protein [Sphingomicrobium marinum]|uniref:hypothetical protein n=1 Tax=Sphingomicrobium marinum TaxID=1227950 RepID=UPI00224052B7|nr:hypothetical protein [Sphingomicrobium marinum]
MNGFQNERAKDVVDEHIEAIEAILEAGHIGLDEGGHCEQEWLDCAAGAHPLALKDWIADKRVEQKIRPYEMPTDPDNKSLNALGLPRKDHKWIRLAKCSDAEAIISNDIDFLDCKKKRANAKAKAKIRENESGATSKWISKNVGCSVWLVCNVCSHLDQS